MTLSPDTKAAVNKYGPLVRSLAKQRYGISGRKLLAKLVVGESGDNPDAVSSAGARGRTQFMPSSRAEVKSKYGVDPWGSADDAVHAAALHLLGKVNGSKGLEGYNPGDPSYSKYILGQKVGKLGAKTGGSKAVTIPGTPAAETTDTSGAVVDALLHHHGSLLDAVTANLDSGRYTSRTPGTPATTASGSKPEAGYLGKVIERANRIDSKHLPYQWGGGHSADAAHKTVALDCSGAVSKVLGINPRVASQFVKWGKPGRGGAITVYAKSTHVLVEINGHFWGTSNSNPGGGAGWIPRSALSAGYLKGFTARHL